MLCGSFTPLQAKKVFRVTRPQALAARLVMAFEPYGDEAEPLLVRLNGREFQFAARGTFWKIFEIPPEVLKEGEGEDERERSVEPCRCEKKKAPAAAKRKPS